MKITAELLEQYGAYCEELDGFREFFPDGLDTETVDPEDLAEFDLDWFAREVLGSTAYDEYQRIKGQAWAEYRRVSDAAFAEYDRARKTPWVEYEQVTTAAYDECRRTRDAAWDEYRRTSIEALIRLVSEYGLKPPAQEKES